MNEKDKNFTSISEDQLSDIAGGLRLTGTYEACTATSSNYSSGDTPKYSVGQQLKISIRNIYRYKSEYVPCRVTAVSSTKDCGFFCKEFGYTVQILYHEHCPEIVNFVVENVFESALYDN